jgi:hypothetical protein
MVTFRAMLLHWANDSHHPLLLPSVVRISRQPRNPRAFVFATERNASMTSAGFRKLLTDRRGSRPPLPCPTCCGFALADDGQTSTPSRRGRAPRSLVPGKVTRRGVDAVLRRPRCLTDFASSILGHFFGAPITGTLRQPPVGRKSRASSTGTLLVMMSSTGQWALTASRSFSSCSAGALETRVTVPVMCR